MLRRATAFLTVLAAALAAAPAAGAQEAAQASLRLPWNLGAQSAHRTLQDDGSVTLVLRDLPAGVTGKVSAESAPVLRGARASEAPIRVAARSFKRSGKATSVRLRLAGEDAARVEGAGEVLMRARISVRDGAGRATSTVFDFRLSAP